MDDNPFLSTKEVARFLDVNEKMIYSLISEKGLPATKVTGKWLFPRHLVQRWLEEHLLNYPKSAHIPQSERVLILVGSHDILLERTIALFNRHNPQHLAVFGNVGSLGGVQAMKQGLCHIAASHLIQDDEQDYNFDFIHQELGAELAAVVNFCRREQGILVARENPKAIQQLADLGRPGVTIVNRPKSTGTRLLFDRELHKAGIDGRQIQGYQQEYPSHLDVALEVLSGRADAAPAIRPVAELVGLDFISLRWERYDFLISKYRFFEEGVQLFLQMLHEETVNTLAQEWRGYDLSVCGRMIFPQHPQHPPSE